MNGLFSLRECVNFEFFLRECVNSSCLRDALKANFRCVNARKSWDIGLFHFKSIHRGGRTFPGGILIEISRGLNKVMKFPGG